MIALFADSGFASVGTWVASLSLVGLAGGLIDSHRRAWNRHAGGDDPTLPADDANARRFASGQYRRRMLASSAIAILGLLIAVRSVVPHSPAWIVSYLALLVGGCVAIMMLGLLDAVASSRFYRRAQRRHRTSADELADALKEARGKGREA